VNYHHNQWQIGKPHKVVFDTASPYTPPNVIVTDTLNPYRPNDTSVFIVRHNFIFSPGISLNFKYQLDIDSGAKAKVEISGDNGLNWINPITQDTTYMFYWGFVKPRLDTSYHTWKAFQLNMDPWMNALPGGADSFPHYRTSDTILFRFTFISDSDTSHHDGWMIDNFFIENAIMEGAVKPALNDNSLSIYPVPSKGNIYYHNSSQLTGKTSIRIYNQQGNEVYRIGDLPCSGFLNFSLPNGNYVLKYINGDDVIVKRLEVLR